MNEARITVTGHVADTPVLRELTSGVRVAGFRIAHTPRRLDRATGAWSDGQTLWFGVTCWRALAEHCAQSLGKGDKVVVTGRLQARTWTTAEGQERSGLEIDARTVGFDLGRTAARAERPAPVLVATDPGERACGLDAPFADAGPGPVPEEEPDEEGVAPDRQEPEPVPALAG